MKELHSERLVLREIRESDAEDFVNNMNHEEMNKYLPGPPYPYTIEDAQGFIKEFGGLKRNNDRVEWAIEYEGVVVGAANLHDIKEKQRSCKIGYAIGKPHWGNGFATETARRLLEYAFEELEMHYVAAEVYVGNEGSLAVAKKLGFVEEGLSKETTYHNGEYLDEYVLGLREQEFKKQ